MIPQSYIDDVLARVNIVDVIDARVKLKKAGKNHVACCPFHDERTPSFSVTEQEGFYYCFGCGASGNAIGFLMDYERLDFKGAVVVLGRALGLGDPSPETVTKDSLQSRIGKYMRLKAQIIDDRLLVEIYKADRATGAQIDPREVPLITETIKRYHAGLEEIKNYPDVEAHFETLKAESLRREAIMVVVCAELQQYRHEYPPWQWVPIKTPLIDTRTIQAAHSRIAAIEKKTSKI